VLHGVKQLVTEISLQTLTLWSTVTLEKLIIAQAFIYYIFFKAEILIAVLYDSVWGLIQSVPTLILNFKIEHFDPLG
jgi:hypothetical protein